MCTQVLFVHLVRTERIPFFQSMADWRVLLLDAVAIALALVIPFTGVGTALGMAAIPAAFLGMLPLIVLGYVVLVMVMRALYVRRFGHLM
jgi:Mg2+-importing ATPase